MAQTELKEEQKVVAEQPKDERVFYSRNQLEVVLRVFGDALWRSGVSPENIRRLKDEIRAKYGKDLPLGHLINI